MATLAQAQLERDKIKAAQAKQAFESAYNATVSKDDANNAKQVIKTLVATALQKLAVQFANAIQGEVDETQVHYLLSDTAHDWLKQIGYDVKDNLASDDIGKAFHKGVKPTELMTVSQCAEKYRYLETGTNMPGPWRNSNAPHIVEIMDALSVHSPTKRVTFKKASGISGTEVWLNWLLYIVKHAKKDVMIVVPTLTLRDRTFNPKIKKLFSESPALADMVSKATRDDANSKDVLEIGPVRIIKSGANSPESFRGEHLPYAITDEKSAMPWDIGGEGNVGMLIDNRLKSFTRSKKFDLSSPTQEGFCQISDDYDAGSQEMRYIFCPECNHAHTLAFKNFTWQLKAGTPEDEKIVEIAYFKCPECDAKIEEHQKDALLDNAVWIAKHPERKKIHRSFTLNSFYIKFGLGYTWKQIAQLWLDSQKDSAKLTTFTNTFLAETSKPKATNIDPNSLLTRLETFPEEMPAVIRIASADIQKDRIEFTLVDFEETKESWVQTHMILEGDPVQDQVWEDLDRELKSLNVDLAMIDSGYLPNRVYDFCESRRWCIPIKGMPGMARPLVEDEVKRKQRLRRRRKKGMPVEPLGVDNGKGLVMARLKFESTTSYDIDHETGEVLSTHRPSNPGYIHFKNDACFDDEYFAQLLAEVLDERMRSGKKLLEWIQTRARNEALDCMVYAIAGFEIALRMRIKFKKIGKNNATVAAGDADHPQKRTRKRRTLRM